LRRPAILLTVSLSLALAFLAWNSSSIFPLVTIGNAQEISPAIATGSAANAAKNVRPASASTPLSPSQFAHSVKRGESVTSLARMYLPQTSFMTVPELESAIRSNNGLAGRSLHPGQSIVIPGIEPQPVLEKSIPVPKDFEVRAIYLTGVMAGSAKGLRLINRWRQMGGNAVVFDIKDSDGILNVPFDHTLNSPARRPVIRNLPKFARYLHSLGMHSIARIAIFRDERLVRSYPELAVHSHRNGGPWRENGKLVWTDPSQPKVQQFNIALASMVANSGIDEVQFDYVRFPAEGDQKDAQFVFQSEHPKWKRSDVIAAFLHDAYAELRPKGVLLSLDVFGVMAWQRPVDLAHTGQDIPAMARFCDVLSPMIYPSHFFGMDGYAHPGDAPEHFIGESMERFMKVTAGTGVVLRPWLQAFAWRTRSYSPAYIVTQVKVARTRGGIGFLFWNARNDYSKPLLAMTEMRSHLFRGDEIPSATSAKSASAAPVGAVPVSLNAPKPAN
jgi:hypothetical protein